MILRKHHTKMNTHHDLFMSNKDNYPGKRGYIFSCVILIFIVLRWHFLLITKVHKLNEEYPQDRNSYKRPYNNACFTKTCGIEKQIHLNIYLPEYTIYTIGG